MHEQINIFEIPNPVKEVRPLLHKGQTVYIRKLDIVEEVVLSGNMWLVEPQRFNKNQEPYYGYGYKSGVLYDVDLGHSIFLDKNIARDAAARMNYDKVYPSLESMNITECVSYEYWRNLDNHRLSATLAKLGDNRAYEKDFMCYSFIRKYPSKAARDKAYSKLLTKIRAESQKENAKELNPPEFETPLYKVGDIYASHGYAYHHLVRWRD